MCYIYRLYDPRHPDKTRYVGKTTKSLELRLRQHLYQSQLNKVTHKTNWIKSLLSENIVPQIELLECVDQQDSWQSKEIFWINHFESTGENLTNSTKGGDGLHGYSLSLEHRSKISKALYGRKGRSGKDNPLSGRPLNPEHREKLSIALKGKPSHMKGKNHSEESKKKMSLSKKDIVPWIKGKNHSEADSAKMSMSKKGKSGAKHSAETKIKCSIAKRGNKSWMFGKHWYYNPSTEESRMLNFEDIPIGWIPGRPLKNKTINI